MFKFPEQFLREVETEAALTMTKTMKATTKTRMKKMDPDISRQISEEIRSQRMTKISTRRLQR
jgi:hypothetical protein